MEKIKPHLAEIVIFLVMILLLSMGTYSRNRLWNNPIDLWKDCVKKSPNKARPYVNLGAAYIEAGVYDKAFEMNQKAIQIDAKYAYAYYNLSILYQKMGESNKAIAMAKKSLEIDPDTEMAYYSLGAILKMASTKNQRRPIRNSLRPFLTFLKLTTSWPSSTQLRRSLTRLLQSLNGRSRSIPIILSPT